MMLDIAILGATGYGGGELLRWLSGHPATASLRGTSRHGGRPFGDVHPNLRGLVEGSFEEEIPWSEFGGTNLPVVFSALPHCELAALLPERCRGRIGSVVCGIPLVLLPAAEQRRFIDTMAAVAPGRGFLHYSYCITSPLPARRYGLTASREAWTPFNLPPASVWRYQAAAP